MAPHSNFCKCFETAIAERQNNVTSNHIVAYGAGARAAAAMVSLNVCVNVYVIVSVSFLSIYAYALHVSNICVCLALSLSLPFICRFFSETQQFTNTITMALQQQQQ